MSRALLFQNSVGHDVGYQIGYYIGRFLPFIVMAVLAFFIIRYFRKKSKK